VWPWSKRKSDTDVVKPHRIESWEFVNSDHYHAVIYFGCTDERAAYTWRGHDITRADILSDPIRDELERSGRIELVWFDGINRGVGRNRD
jgi:hypothetical protein